MESNFPELSSPGRGFKDNSLTHPAISYHSRNICNAVEINDPPVISDSAEITSLPHQPEPISCVQFVPISFDGDLNLPSKDTRPAVGMLRHSISSGESPNKVGESLSLSDHSNSKDPVLKYINQMLMEENMEEQPWVVPNIMALRHTEKSLYDALGKKYPDSPKQTERVDTNQVINSSSWSSCGSSGDQGSNGTISSISNSCHSLDPNSHDGPEGNGYASINTKSLGDVVHSNVDRTFQSSINSVDSLPKYGYKFSYSVPSELLIRQMFNKSESVLQFNKGLEEAKKFIPSSIHISINQEKGGLAATIRERAEIGLNGSNQSENGSRGKKNHERHCARIEEGRANKQLASYNEDSELSDLIEKLLLSNKNGGLLSLKCKSGELSGTKDFHDPSGIGLHSRKKGNESTSDLRSLLILCAQAVSSNDFKTAHGLLKKIRQDSSPSSDGSRRAAHYFANGLEARLAGSAGRSQAF